MRIIYGNRFARSAKKIPADAQRQLASVVKQIFLDPFAPTLRSKRLHGKFAGIYSCRITHDYRLLFIFTEQTTIKLILVGHRKDIYR